MAKKLIRFYVGAKAEKSVSIEDLHRTVMQRLEALDGPLGIKNAPIPPVPDCGDGLSVTFALKLLTKGLRCFGTYVYRGATYIYKDSPLFDDDLTYEFKSNNPFVNYSDLLLNHLPVVAKAFGAYIAYVSYSDYPVGYAYGFNPDEESGFDATGNEIRQNEVYNQLVADPQIDANSRGFIFELHPAQFWSDELCNKALGYGKDEVIRRLEGQIRLLQDYGDGVYFVLNDNRDLTFNEFVDMNKKYKKILGLR